MMQPILLTVAGNFKNQDRAIVMHDGPRIVLCVADGAGGHSGGAEAAVMAVEFIRQHAASLESTEACTEALRKLDAVISGDRVAGETTCAIAVANPDEVFGASVGDSGVWLIPGNGSHEDLTFGQQRQPLIGSGAAWPVPFRHRSPRGCLLLATDGLLKYTSVELIVATCREHPAEEAAQQLLKLVTYPSGGLPDDVTLILTRFE